MLSPAAGQGPGCQHQAASCSRSNQQRAFLQSQVQARGFRASPPLPRCPLPIGCWAAACGRAQARCSQLQGVGPGQEEKGGLHTLPHLPHFCPFCILMTWKVHPNPTEGRGCCNSSQKAFLMARQSRKRTVV